MKHRLRIIAVAAALILANGQLLPARAEQQPDAKRPIVRIDSGRVQGAHAGGLLVFKGIPYAAPPIGDLRWRPPVAPEPWSDVRQALTFGNDCEQTRRDWDVGRADAPMHEDCLTLNIWAPQEPPLEGAPVMLWIHGGSFTAGSSAQPVYDGARLSARGVVIVTINYRLGRFGFFAHPALTHEAAGGPVGNYGIMDQIAALRWVKRNIRAFGGDPGNVTIFGESSGGGSVNILMASAEARDLFQGAIAQSGGGRDRLVQLAAAEAKGEAFAAKSGLTTDDPAALRAIAVDVVRGQMSLLNPEAATYSGPFIDGRIITEDVDSAFASGRQSHVPYLAGSNSDEIAFLAEPMRAPMTAQFKAVIGADLEAIEAAYGSAEALDSHIVGDAIFAEPARFLVHASAHNGAYLYNFDYVPEAERATSKGAAHGSDVSFVFGTLDTLKTPVSEADSTMAQAVGDYWTAFAKTGRPAASGLPCWPQFVPDKPVMMVFTAGGPVVNSAASPALDALEARAEREKDKKKTP